MKPHLQQKRKKSKVLSIPEWKKEISEQEKRCSIDCTVNQKILSGEAEDASAKQKSLRGFSSKF